MSIYYPPARPDELYHFGILGMKWGIRRYQNPDGTLTSLGRKRISQGKGKLDKKSGLYMKTTRKERRHDKQIREQRKKNIAKVNKNKKLYKTDKLKPQDMSDKQIDERIARLKKEKEYIKLLSETRTSEKGKSYVKEFLSKSGDNFLNEMQKTATKTLGEAAAKAILDKVFAGEKSSSLGDYVISGIKSNSKKNKDKDD